MLMVNAEEYAIFPINGEPNITDNHCGIQQHWSKVLMLHHIINNRGEIKYLSDIITPVHPISMEYDAIKRTLGGKC